MAGDKVLFAGHPVAAVAATSPAIAKAAAKLIKVDYEVLPHVIDVDEAMKPDAPLLHPNMITQGVTPPPTKPSNIAKRMELALGDIDAGFKSADIVVACTASPVPLITRALTRDALHARRRRRPIFMVDLAVPRDIEPEVADLEDVYLFSIDDLQKVVDENLHQRELAAGGAKLLIEEEVARFIAEARAHDAGPAIRALRAQANDIRSHTVEQAKRMLLAGRPGEEVIDFLANTLTNRLLHAPTQALRHASESADTVLAEAITRLLVEDRGRQ